MTTCPAARRVCSWQAGKHRFALGSRTCLVGVVNITPDSFFDGGRFLEPREAIDQGLRLIDQGADLLDLGAESSRPGSDRVPEAEEIRRLVPVIRELKRLTDAPLMVDTYKSSVARVALSEGACAINDISAFHLDPALSDVVADSDAGVVLSHLRGTPTDMQRIPPSPDIQCEILEYFDKVLNVAESKGILRDRIVLDPGIGFGKTLEDNLLLLNRLETLSRFGMPILVGTSRKSFIGKILDLPPEERLWGTAGSVAAAAVRGAHLMRVHDIKEMRQVLEVVDSILTEKGPR